MTIQLVSFQCSRRFTVVQHKDLVSTKEPDKGARSPLLHQNKREMWIGLAAVKMMALFAKEMRLKKVVKTTPWDVEDDLVSGHIQMVHQYPTNQLALTRRR
jgi:hypothetical protein